MAAQLDHQLKRIRRPEDERPIVNGSLWNSITNVHFGLLYPVDSSYTIGKSSDSINTDSSPYIDPVPPFHGWSNTL
ncbi:hypothetical protein N7478_007741 [Penicillium angulare]|uniref:uncharacterized protein n=1 Tax=Penicillium angulare TaxID=116970 RepID=UPI002541D239|nr:uncharacterized protein N7478_007741 [Penicillium angulare]KAJ5272616.1 hypothetical protein N7478_007741 [Penicillium angulare]